MNRRNAVMADKQSALMTEALNVYGISPEFVFDSKELSEDEIVIVTKGGKKVRHTKGAAAQFALSYTEISGNPEEKEEVHCPRLGQKIDLKKDIVKSSFKKLFGK
jgi:hypothetical protein